MLCKRVEIGQVFEGFQDQIEMGLGRAQALALVAEALIENNPDIARALTALSSDMVEDRMRALGCMERLIEAARAGEITGSVGF